MASSARYFDLVREMKDAYNHRLRLAHPTGRPHLSERRGNRASLEEDEFFDLEDFTSRGDFLAKVHT